MPLDRDPIFFHSFPSSFIDFLHKPFNCGKLENKRKSHWVVSLSVPWRIWIALDFCFQAWHSSRHSIKVVKSSFLDSELGSNLMLIRKLVVWPWANELLKVCFLRWNGNIVWRSWDYYVTWADDSEMLSKQLGALHTLTPSDVFLKSVWILRKSNLLVLVSLWILVVFCTIHWIFQNHFYCSSL